LAGLGDGLGTVFVRLELVSTARSGVVPLVGTRDTGAKPDARLGFGEGFREEALDGSPNLLLLFGMTPAFDSDELVRL